MNQLPTTTTNPRSTSRLSRTDRGLAAAAVARMMSGFRQRAEGAADIVATYVDGLDDLPLLAIAEACDRLFRGREPGRNAAFAPSVAEVHEVAARLALEWFEQERRRVPRALPRPDSRDDPVMRERVAKLLAGLAAEMNAGLDRAHNEVLEQRRARTNRRLAWEEERRIRACEAAGVDPVLGISVGLARKLGAAPAQSEAPDAA